MAESPRAEAPLRLPLAPHCGEHVRLSAREPSLWAVHRLQLEGPSSRSHTLTFLLSPRPCAKQTSRGKTVRTLTSTSASVPEASTCIISSFKPPSNSKVAIITLVFAKFTEQIRAQVQACPRASPSQPTTPSTLTLHGKAYYTRPAGLPLRDSQLCEGRLPFTDLCLPQCSS